MNASLARALPMDELEGILERACGLAFAKGAARCLADGFAKAARDADADAETFLARLLAQQVWGQGFPWPAFCDRFTVESQRVVGEKHLRLRLRKEGQLYDGMLFFHKDPLPPRLQAVYRPDVNEYAGSTSLQLVLQHWEPA